MWNINLIMVIHFQLAGYVIKEIYGSCKIEFTQFLFFQSRINGFNFNQGYIDEIYRIMQ